MGNEASRNLLEKTVLLATDLPFWQRSDGAQQRIHQLVQQLCRMCRRVVVFYLGPSDIIPPVDADVHFEVRAASSAEPPNELGPKLKWYLDAVWNQWGSSGVRTPQTSPDSMKLGDFEWAWARQKFGECFRDIDPEVVIVEYVKLAYLLDGLKSSERRKCFCAIDTHDVLHRRFDQFRERGLSHWIELTAQEEADVLARFDAIIAIQPSEAETFQKLLRTRVDPPTVHVVGFASGVPASPTAPRFEFKENEVATFGYIGSNNASNEDACRWLLKELWPAISDAVPRSQLVIAGSVCGCLVDQTLGDRVTVMGRVEHVETFYHNVDVVLNPVRFGTGLKIKNAEALGFGRPLITTENGWDGLPFDNSGTSCVFIASDGEDLVEAAVSWGADPVGHRQRVQSAVFFSENEFSEDRVYSELHSMLNTYNR